MVGLRPDLAIGRNQHDRRAGIEPPQRRFVVPGGGQRGGAAFDDDQIGVRGLPHPLPVVQIFLQRRRSGRARDANHRPRVGEQPPAHRSRQPAA